jgi:hypothetical protein
MKPKPNPQEQPEFDYSSAQAGRDEGTELVERQYSRVVALQLPTADDGATQAFPLPF